MDTIKEKLIASLGEEKAEEMLNEIRLVANEVKSVEVQLADDKLKNEYGEDWLTYRDDRLKELANERDSIREAIPDRHGRTVDVQGRPEEGVDTPSPHKRAARRRQYGGRRGVDTRSDSIVS